MFEYRIIGGIRGIFAVQAIPNNTDISSPFALSFPTSQLSGVSGLSKRPNTHLWDNNNTAFVLGPLAVVKHSTTPNCTWIVNKNRGTMTLRSNRAIVLGEELTVTWTNPGVID